MIQFQDAVKSCMTVNYRNFKGRAPRSEYWWFMLFYGIVNAVSSQISAIAYIGPIASLAISIAMFIPYLAVSVRRFHDLDKSGMPAILAIIMPPVLSLLATVFGVLGLLLLSEGMLTLSAVLWLLTAAAAIYLIIQTVRPGTTGDNQFGPDPLAVYAAQQAAQAAEIAAQINAQQAQQDQADQPSAAPEQPQQGTGENKQG